MMTREEVITFVISRWLAEQPTSSIVVHLLCLGHPVSKADVLAIIRRYVDLSSENGEYRRRA